MTAKRDFELYLRGKSGKHKPNRRNYTNQEKRALLTEAAPMILGGISIRTVSFLIIVPYDTLYQWVRKINEEGISSIENKTAKKGEDGQREMFLAVEWIEKQRKRPTPKNFREAVFSLRLKRKPISLYLYYRKHISNQ